jgi:KaiC/GvpD/RAD55 family RecA-like ATPase
MMNAHAEEYIYALTGSPSTEISIQVFDDSKEKDISKARIYTGTLHEYAKILDEHNKNGCGIFAFVNELDGQGHSEPNVKALRAAFVDCDTGPLGSMAVRPSFMVHSVSGEHGYWLLEPGEDIGKYRALQRSLAVKLGTDTNICNPNRVMRIPGFKHVKGEPTDVALTVLDVSTRYTIAQLTRAFQLNIEVKTKAEKPGRSIDKAEAIERCSSYMEAIPPAIEGEGGDHATFRAACVGQDFGLTDDEFWPILCRWNRRCEPPWDDKDLRRKLRNASRYRVNPIGVKAVERTAPPPNWDDEEPPPHGEFEQPPEAPETEKPRSTLHVHSPAEVCAIWQDESDLAYVPTFLTSLNHASGGGFPIGYVTVVTAYTGCYKSEFVRQAIKHAALNGCGAIHVDIELGYRDIYSRYASELSAVPHSIVRDRKRRTKEHTAFIMDACETLNRHKWGLICPPSGISIGDLELVLARAMPDTTAKPTLVAFDSLQRLATGMDLENPRMRVEAFCQWMESFAKKYNVAVLVVSEQSRSQSGGKPKVGQALTAGAESRSVEYVAGMLLALDAEDCDEDDEPDVIEDCDGPGERVVGIRIPKSRVGREGSIRERMVFMRPCWKMRIDKTQVDGLEGRVLGAMEADPKKLWSIRAIKREIGSKHQAIKSKLVALEKKNLVTEVDKLWVVADKIEEEGHVL